MTTQQATASAAESAAVRWGPQGAVAQTSSELRWQAFQEYAEQLRAAGHQRQAEAYYRHAQTLREQAQIRQGNQSKSIEENNAASTSQTLSKPVTITNQGVYVDPALVSEAAQVTRRVSRVRTIVLWALATLGVALLIFISGVVALVSFYKDQLREGTTAAAPPNSVVGCVQHVTFNPMAAALQPVFDKTMRLSAAVQPLLYELSLRDTPPVDYYAGTLRSVGPSTGSFEGAVNGSDPRLAAILDPSPTRETAASPDQTPENTEPSPASAEPEESEEKDDSHGGDPVASPHRDDSSVAAAREVETGDKRSPSSRTSSRKSPGNRNNEAAHRNQAQGASATPFDSTPPAGAPSKTSELDRLLTSTPNEQKRPNPSAGDPSQNVKAFLSREDVQRGMAQVTPWVKQCGQGRGGTVSMKIVINRKGRISSAVPMGIYRESPIGACVAQVVRRARFPLSGQSLTVQYPFKL